MEATYDRDLEVLTLKFDQAMDDDSLPDENLILMNWDGEVRRGSMPIAWIDVDTLQMATAPHEEEMPNDTTKCLDTTGLVAAVGGGQAETWNDFPLDPA